MAAGAFSSLVSIVNKRSNYETSYLCKSDYYITDYGCLLVLSGLADADIDEKAGVGFLIAPSVRKCIVGFCQASSRMASLKLRVRGGKTALVVGYAPHNGKPVTERQRFYSEFTSFIAGLSCHGPKIVVGDFNARLHRRLSGEEALVGPYVFGERLAQFSPESNRSLLIELCSSLGLVIANTFFDEPPEKQITCYNVGAEAMSPATPANHGQLDFMLISRDWLSQICSVHSDRSIALASHHFLVLADVQLDVARGEKFDRQHRPDVCTLMEPTVSTIFRREFETTMSSIAPNEAEEMNVDAVEAAMGHAFKKAAESLRKSSTVKHQPWISDGTLLLIEARNRARSDRDKNRERGLNIQIRKSVKKDRSQWLDKLLVTGDWSQIRRLRKGFVPAQGRLKNIEGVLVDSDLRAETLAEYYEKAQWRTRPTTPSRNSDALGPDLPINCGPISEADVIKAARRLKRNRAAGSDKVPGEFWKAICKPGTAACQWATTLCHKCFEMGVVPEKWHEALVVAIFKKGDVASCENYRPISLLQIGYKLFATILPQRLKDGGAESRIWPTQYGFRSKYGTTDALFIARRLLDEAWSGRGSKAIFLALDWAKAFDSVSPEALLLALQRFGLPEKFCASIRAIYTAREFSVRDAGQTSEKHSQSFGICQGCPLSPFLFSMVMTVLIRDAKNSLSNDQRFQNHTGCLVSEILYADDTLLIDTQPGNLEIFMHAVQHAGAEYGLAFNWSKLEVLAVRCEADIPQPGGGHIRQKDSIIYLGSLLCSDGRIDSELSRRLGVATSDFRALAKVWRHSSITRARKVELFNACVVSKLLYALHVAWLGVAGQRRLDAFQARCLRKIFGIGHSYWSRVSNEAVRCQARSKPLSELLLERQLLLMGSIARRSDTDVSRKCVFEPGTVNLRQLGRRRRGRPRHTWCKCVYEKALEVAGGASRLNEFWQPTVEAEKAWKKAVADSLSAG